MLNFIILKHGFAAVEIKVFELEIEFELPQNVLRFTHFLHSIRHFVFFLEHDSQAVNKIGSQLFSLTSFEQV